MSWLSVFKGEMMVHTFSKMTTSRGARLAASVIAGSAMVVGVAAPALSLTRVDDKTGSKVWNGDESARWQDDSPNYTDPRVTVDAGCRKEFRLEIWKDEPSWYTADKKRGEEWIDCWSYDDAVYAEKKELKSTYHYSVKSIPNLNCYGGGCTPDYTSFLATVRW